MAFVRKVISLRRALDMCIAGSALSLAVFLLMPYLSGSGSVTPNKVSDLDVGISLPVSNWAWDRYPFTLVIVLSISCASCNDGAGTYQYLAATAANNQVPVLIIMPSSER